MTATSRRRALLALAVGVMLAMAGAGSARAEASAGLVGYWTFDAGSGTTAADATSPGHPLTLAGGAGWGPGVVGANALSLDGRGEYAAASGAVVSTMQSYTVAAWVRPTSVDGYQTYVSQDGSQVSGFFLQLLDGHFAFSVPQSDSTHAVVTVASDAAVIPQPGEWYHLVGVFDAQAQTISLYVNGTLAQTTPAPAAWTATGPFAVGRGLYGGRHVDFVNGSIDDVRVYSGTLDPTAIAALAGPGRLAVDASVQGARTHPTQFGEFLEEINHSGDGGLYGELIRNRDLKVGHGPPVGWSSVGSPAPSLSIDRSDPLTAANPLSLKLAVPASPASGRVGVANAGWWGMPVIASTSYRVSFYARAAGAGTRAPLTVDLESDAGNVWASTAVGRPGTGWRRYTATLTTPAGIMSSEDDRFVISAPARGARGGTDWFALVSVFPPTYDKTPNGFRVDLMRRLAALHPGFLRIPGGNALEGDTLASRFDWRNTIGPIEDRPGHRDTAWGYWSQDGLGLLEYLELAEELHARPILDVWAGYTLNGKVVPRAQLEPYVRQAVEEIEYATDPTSTYWGHQRALDGHPAPFPLHMVEIGNEDFFDGSGSYGSYRYPMFYDAIHSAFPHIRMIATEPVSSRPVYAVDHHYYSNDPTTFARDAHLFDDSGLRQGRVLVGEYAADAGSPTSTPLANATNPTGTLADALGEAAFLTGTVRDSRVVIGTAYAPLLVNVHAPSWPTNLIGFDALHSYVSPSYWAQQMFADNLGERVIATSVVSGTGTLFDVATESPGHVYLAVVNDGPVAASVDISLAGLGNGASGGTATVLGGAPAAQNTLTDRRQVFPQSASLTALGRAFAYSFPADSLTILNLSVVS